MDEYRPNTTYRLKVSFKRILVNEGVINVTTPPDFSGDDIDFNDLVQEALDTEDINGWDFVDSTDEYDILSEDEVEPVDHG